MNKVEKTEQSNENSKINDLIFKELIKRGYSLEGNTRVWNIADSKLWYLTPEQAQAYLDVEKSEKFKELADSVEFELLDGSIKDIQDEIGKVPINVVDLGCGDGKKGAFVVKKLKNKEIRYCPVDISSYMVEKAIDTFSEMNVEAVVDFRYNISDFENLENITPLLTKENFKQNLFLLLGYTLGNFEINEILYEIRSAMKGNDLLVIVSGIASEQWKKWIETSKGNDKMNSFFVKIPLQLGLKEEDVEFGVRLQHGRVEYYYTLLGDKNIKFQDKAVHFSKGDQIVVAVAYKHEKEDLLTYLNIYFDKVEMKISKDGATFLALCKK